MDITLHLIIKPAIHALDGMKAASRFSKGDVIDAYKATKYATLQPDGNYLLDKPPGHPRFAFVHIKNIPDFIDKAKIKAKLTSELKILNGTVRRCEWHVPPSILPAAFKQKLLTEKQITVNWATAKSYIRKKTTPVVLDPSQDDISTPLTDGDIN